MKHPLLIDTETLQSRLGTPGLVVIDVRGNVELALSHQRRGMAAGLVRRHVAARERP